MCSFCSSNPICHRLLSYRYDRLNYEAEVVNAEGMVKLRLFIKSLNIIMKKRHFDLTDPITVFQFFIRFVTEDDMMIMLKG